VVAALLSLLFLVLPVPGLPLRRPRSPLLGNGHLGALRIAAAGGTPTHNRRFGQRAVDERSRWLFPINSDDFRKTRERAGGKELLAIKETENEIW